MSNNLKILNIVELNLFKSILRKYFVTKEIETVFIPPDENIIQEKIRELIPKIIVIQDEYTDKTGYEILTSVHDEIYRMKLETKIVIVCIKEEEPDYVDKSDDYIIIKANEMVDIDKYLSSFIDEYEITFVEEEELRKKILYVDDSKTMHSFINKYLDWKKYKISHAYDGKEALELYHKVLPELIITDIEMPVMDGFEFCKNVKEKNKDRYIPIIILSTRDKELDIDTAFKYGADDYIVKPVMPEVLINKIEEFFTDMERKKKSRILIVDDSKVTREYIRHALLKQGFNVDTAEDGIKAMDKIKENKPEILLTDVEMPGMDGYELCASLNNEPELNDISKIMMSSLDKPHDILKGKKLGVIHYFTKPFDIEKLVLFIDRILLEKYMLYQKEIEYMLISIKSLVKALEARDGYTKGHSERVANLSMQLARFMNLPDSKIKEVEISASLHDIGKIGVKDNVLFKEGPLTDEEYTLIQEHAITGAEILKPIKSLRKLIPLILYHHERWDGKGYPSKINGENIPLGARIISIADTFDAITSSRPYRKKMNMDKALEIIKENSGTQLCPECANAFIEMIEKGDVY